MVNVFEKGQYYRVPHGDIGNGMTPGERIVITDVVTVTRVTYKYTSPNAGLPVGYEHTRSAHSPVMQALRPVVPFFEEGKAYISVLSGYATGKWRLDHESLDGNGRRYAVLLGVYSGLPRLETEFDKWVEA